MRCQRNRAQVKRTEQNSRKGTKQNGDKHLSDAKFKTLVIRMLKELIRYFNSIKTNKQTNKQKTPGRNEGYTK